MQRHAPAAPDADVAMLYKNLEALDPIKHLLAEASEGLASPSRTIDTSSMKEVLGAAAGAGLGGVGSFIALYTLGTAGLSAVGITSALAAAGALVGGGMVAVEPRVQPPQIVRRELRRQIPPRRVPFLRDDRQALQRLARVVAPARFHRAGVDAVARVLVRALAEQERAVGDVRGAVRVAQARGAGVLEAAELPLPLLVLDGPQARALAASGAFGEREASPSLRPVLERVEDAEGVRRILREPTPTLPRAA